MMLVVKIPLHCQSELEWVCSVLFGEILGVRYRIEVKNNLTGVRIALPNGSNINIEDHFLGRFQNRADRFTEENIPKCVTLANNSFSSEAELPVIFGTNSL